MGDVHTLEVRTTLDIPPDKLLQNAIDAGLTEVIIIGWKDKQFYASYSRAELEAILYGMERARFELMLDDHEENKRLET